jgi:putative ABC transport system ATP-binding protein
MAWLSTDQLCRYYRRGPSEIKAVDGVSLEIERGEFVGIIGSSGSGKSTLLNLLAGLDTPTTGHIAIADQRLDQLSRRALARYRAERVGMVFQSFNLLQHFTALANVELALYFTDTPASERRTRAMEVMDRLGLGDRTDHHPSDLSGGEQQRVAIARALVKRPEILFADEPTGNLDFDNSRQIADLLTELHGEGLTVVLVSHDVELVANRTQRYVKMHYGQLVPPGESTP